MTLRRFALCGALVLVAQGLVAGVLFELIGPRFNDPALFRLEGEQHIVPYVASRVLFVGLFVYIFSWCGRSGWWGGLRYGLIIWLFYSVPMTVGFWSFLRMPGRLALAWIGIGFAELVASGLILGLMNRQNRGGPTLWGVSAGSASIGIWSRRFGKFFSAG